MTQNEFEIHIDYAKKTDLLQHIVTCEINFLNSLSQLANTFLLLPIWARRISIETH